MEFLDFFKNFLDLKNIAIFIICGLSFELSGRSKKTLFFFYIFYQILALNSVFFEANFKVGLKNLTPELYSAILGAISDRCKIIKFLMFFKTTFLTVLKNRLNRGRVFEKEAEREDLDFSKINIEKNQKEEK